MLVVVGRLRMICDGILLYYYYLDDYYSTIVISKQRLNQYEPCLLLNMSNVDDKECISVIAVVY